MEISDNGLLKKMKLQNFSEDIIVRLFSDLLIASGDTVSFAAKTWNGKAGCWTDEMKKSCWIFH